MHAQDFRTNLENLLVLTRALYNAYWMEYIQGIDGLDEMDQSGGD